MSLGGTPKLARGAIAASGAVLAGVALFSVLPELAVRMGWLMAAGAMLVGYALLWIFDRYVHPVCPSCAQTHDHDSCTTRLHGFATPLLVAAVLHNLLDGWSLAWSQQTAGMREAIFWGLALHKAPEGLALGAILRAALPSRARALAGCVAVQVAMIAGSWIASLAAPGSGARGLDALFALAGAGFLYLGGHAAHAEWRRRRGRVSEPRWSPAGS